MALHHRRPPSRCCQPTNVVVPQAMALSRRNHFDDSTTRPSKVQQQHEAIPPPTSQQLQSVMIHSALPMVGFGLMDQTIMIHAGNAIDCTIGVTLGLSTLAAAAVGQIVANAGGILFGETLQHFFTTKLPLLQSPGISGAQSSLAVVARAKLTGTFWGLVFGCTLGLLNLLLIDTERSSNLKLIQTLDNNDDDQDLFAVEIDIRNNHDYKNDGGESSTVTILTIHGPDVDGVLASMVTALTDEGCSLVELSAKPKAVVSTGDDSTVVNKTKRQQCFEDVFIIKRNGAAIPEDELDGLAHRLWDALKSPLNLPTLTAKFKEMELKNIELEKQIEQLKKGIARRQVTSYYKSND